ncbi:hypothetical protein K438DRAFT_1853437 [Mycena galopus ATCC 62051]|nr:hypothetical protein K438DRAFT_1853437 [Mycena galopus ATCC 62051]
MRKTAEITHSQLLELISNLSNGSISDRSSSVYLGAHEPKNSSNSLILLPSKPKIFHGRDSEMGEILNVLGQAAPRIAILGGGGMGKTTLAQAVLHHPDVASKFEQRFFVSTESASNSVELAALVGFHLGLNPGQDLTKPIIQYFSKQPPCLLILDNLETAWEPIQSRNGIEKFLSLLTDVDHIALIITMRGAERPAQVRWTHPFLLPLKPLSDEAAQQIFIEITDNHDIKDMNQLLRFTDNMPLAVNLIAHLADFEGCASVVIRWEAEKTSLLSVGYDKRSNLEASISLSLLSILPDGLSDVELLQSNLPIPNLLKCKAILLATSLAYQDNKKRLRSLIPIREYMYRHCPPSQLLLQSLRKYFHLLLDLYKKYNGEQLKPVVTQITSNLGNLQEILRQELQDDGPILLIPYTAHYFTGHVCTTLMDYIPPIASCLIQALLSGRHHPTITMEQLIAQVTTQFQHVNDLILEAQFYWAAGMYYDYKWDPSRPMPFFEKALRLATLSSNTHQQCNALIGIARVQLRVGNYAAVKIHTSEVQRLSKLSANLYQEARALWIKALCCGKIGDYLNSIACHDTAREILHQCGLMSQAEVHLFKSEYAQARHIHVQMVEPISADPTAEGHAYGLINLAEIDVAIGAAPEEVCKNLNHARTIFNSLRLPVEIMFCDMILADLELREGSTISARTRLHNCIKMSEGRGMEVLTFCLERLADVNRWISSGFNLEFTWPVVYLAHAYHLKEKLPLHKALLFMGDVFISHKDNSTARNLFTVALGGFTDMDVHRSRAQCMLRLGDLADKKGDSSRAIEFWTVARPLFTQSLQAKDIAWIDKRLIGITGICQQNIG